MISILRFWSRLRQELSAQCEFQSIFSPFWGTTGQSCDLAGWMHQALHSNAEAKGWAIATLFTDLSKFYEHIDHGILKAEADDCGFPSSLLVPLTMVYSGWRAVAFQESCSQAFQADGSIVAGCPAATTFAKVVLIKISAISRSNTPRASW